MIILEAARHVLRRGALLGSVSLTLMTAGGARAEPPMDRPVEFHVSGGDLDHALTQAADQSGVHIFFPSASVSGKKSAGLSGKLTVNQALARLLSGSGLSWHLQDGKTIIVSPSSNITLGPVRVGGSIERQDPTGPGVGYVAENTMAGTKTNTSVTEIPNSIYVVTKQQMIDQQAQSVQDALKYTAGIYSGTLGTNASGSAADSNGAIYQRGFTTTQFVDGLLSNSVSAGETNFLERVEAINGPASVMYGQTAPGGMIAMSLKKPTETPLHQVSVGFGNWGRYEATADVSDKITKSGNVRYRLAAIGVTQGTQTDHVDYKRVGVLPSITWDIDKKTSLTLLGSYMYTPGTGITTAAHYPVVGTLIDGPNGRIARSTFLSTPNWNANSATDAMFEYQFNHNFNKFVNFSQTFRWEKSDFNGKETFWDGQKVPGQVYIRPEWIQDTWETVTLDTRLFGKFNTGPVSHTWVVGSDFQNYHDNWSYKRDNASPEMVVDIYNPRTNYTPCFSSASSAGCNGWDTASRYDYFQEGVYFQDQIKWHKLSILLGGREDWVNYKGHYSTYTYNNSAGQNTSSMTYGNDAPEPAHAFTWRGGIIYNFDFGLTPYFSYSTSFVPQTGQTDYLGRPFAPLTGKQLEAGLKYKVPNRDILLTAAAFHIEENHYLITDSVHTDYSADAGQVKSQGFEVAANANITKDLRVIASYSFTDVRFANSNNTNTVFCPETGKACSPTVTRSEQGKFVPYVPRNMFSVFADYKLPKKLVRGLGINWGMRYIGFTYADDVESYKVPSYVLFDVGAHYDFGDQFPILRGLRAQLAMSNITNKYYETSCSRGGCYLGQGRRVYGNLTYNW